MKYKMTLFLSVVYCLSFAQINAYSYKREIKGRSDTWQRIILPDDIFGKLSPSFSDLRFYGIKENGDTIEAPYILDVSAKEDSRKNIAFNLINKSQKGDGYFFTFELSQMTSVNEMELEFEQRNFDWKASLEGGQELNEWFSIIKDYRLVSIKNSLTDFQFTKLVFPDSKYKYFRLFIRSDVRPEIVSAQSGLSEHNRVNVRVYDQDGNFNSKADEKQSHQTVYTITMKYPVPVAGLTITVKDEFDYYRPLRIEYLSDSFKTTSGWKYNYAELTSGTLNSFEKGRYFFNSTIVKKMRVVIDNQDNVPLQINQVTVNGYQHSLIARFSEPADYYLVYGNPGAAMPDYDIARFSDKIPAVLGTAESGYEMGIEKKVTSKPAALFENKLWLWIVMGCVIVILGMFSLMMIRNKERTS